MVVRESCKRLIREACRLNKGQLTDKVVEEGKQLALAFIYLSDRVMEFHEIRQSMTVMLSEMMPESSEA